MRKLAILLALAPACASAQSVGTVALCGPSTGCSEITRAATVNAAINAALMYKADALNPVITGQLSVTNNYSVMPTNGPSGVVGGSQIASSMTAGWSGGISGVIANQVDYTKITGAPNTSLWGHLSALNYSGTGGNTNTQHTADYGQAVRWTYATGGASTNPQIWAAVAESDDFTGVQSSLTGAQLSEEFDLTGSGVDDAQNRQGLVLVLELPSFTSPLGYYGVNSGVSIQTKPGVYANTGFGFGGNYVNAVMDLRYASSAAKGAGGLNAQIAATVTSAVTASVTVPVSNVMPFTLDVYGRDINVTASTAGNITFGDGQTANVASYSITGTGATPSGTLTLKAPITEASGVAVYNKSNAIWLPTGHTIALDTVAATTIGSDGTTITLTGAENVSGALTVGGALNLTGIVKATGGIQIGSSTAATITTDGVTNPVLIHGLPVRVPGYTAASLPAVTSANQGTTAFCNNCFNLGEYVATGVVVTQNDAGAWFTPWGQTTATAATAPSLVLSQPVKLAPFTIAAGANQIPACSAATRGALAYVTDGAASPVYYATQAGGGSSTVKVFCNSVNWVND